MAADLNAQSSDLVDLNIGGEHFVTIPRSILTQGDSELAGLFSGSHKLNADSEGRVLINRDPRCFEYVLDYFRGGLVLPPLPESQSDRAAIRREFEFFGLYGAIAQLPWLDKLDARAYSSYRLLFDEDSVFSASVQFAALSDDNEYLLVL